MCLRFSEDARTNEAVYYANGILQPASPMTKYYRGNHHKLLSDPQRPSEVCLHHFLARCYNCGGLDHHAKECGLPPQPKKCHYCQSIMHMVAQCPQKALAPPTGSQDHLYPSHSAHLYPPDEEARSGSSPLEGPSSSPEEPPQSHRGGPQRWRK
ncbi:hypothetical protein J4Q44_G00317460 [Coregonus suidteri]|uniref:CCHC-type domain-containing protein n=1 Tax=Coregonus suidteri TaxID=861788 RepID=A0AAN8KSZ8_9TELE